MKKFIMAGLSVLLIAAAPTPQGYVNDFANVIPDDREAVIEKSLRDYEARTTIEIAVVTTPSLEGKEIEEYSYDLATAWGVGKDGADNGVFVTIAPNDRKWRVEVGSGLEGDLTDADARLMGERILVDPFRAGDFPGGIENLTKGLMDHLGLMTPDQRAAFHRKVQVAEKRKAEAFKADVLALLGWVLAIVLMFALAWFITHVVLKLVERRRIRIRNEERREALLLYLNSVDPIPAQLMAELSTIDLPNLPAWLQDDKERHTTALEESLVEVVRLGNEILSFLDTDLDKAEKLKADLAAALQTAQEKLELIRTLPEQVVTFRAECERVVADACKEIDDLAQRVEALVKKKYRVMDLVPAINTIRLQQERQSINALLNNRGEGLLDASEAVHDKATRLLSKVTSLRKDLEVKIEMQSTSQARIQALTKRIATFPALLQEHQERVRRLQGLAPRNRWLPFQEGLPVFERTLSGIAPRTEAAARANSMEVQLFADAQETLGMAEAALRTVDATFSDAKELESAIVKAKQSHMAKFRAAETAVSKASRLISDSDVGSGAKSRLSEARRMMDGLRVEDSSTDWIAVNELLEQASAKAAQASQLAENDIEAAERERRRQREAEERRRQRAQESSYSSNSYSSSSSSSNSSFGGFGGGGFSGGGASGDW